MLSSKSISCMHNLLRLNFLSPLISFYLYFNRGFSYLAQVAGELPHLEHGEK